MSRARHKMKELRHTKDKVQYLRYKKQEHCFAKMPQYRNHGERHASKVAVRIANKHLRRIPATQPAISCMKKNQMLLLPS